MECLSAGQRIRFHARLVLPMEIVPNGAIFPSDAFPKPLAHTEPSFVPSRIPTLRIRAIGASACPALSDDSVVEGEGQSTPASAEPTRTSRRSQRSSRGWGRQERCPIAWARHDASIENSYSHACTDALVAATRRAPHGNNANACLTRVRSWMRPVSASETSSPMSSNGSRLVL